MNLHTPVPAAKRRGLSASTLKIIACVTMLIDHVGAYILTDMEILRSHRAQSLGDMPTAEEYLQMI